MIAADRHDKKIAWDSDVAHRRFLGVLGGMGPLASAQFMQRLTLLTDQKQDQDHIPALLWSDPRIPDRTDARLKGGEDPLAALVAGTRGLLDAGAKAIVIPCNSAHLWHDELVKRTHAHVLHIVHAVLKQLKKAGIHEGSIGLLAATATVNLGLYQSVLEPAGYTCVQLQPYDQENICMRSIRHVKANELEAAYPLAIQGAEQLQREGATAIVLGCTEFAIAIPDYYRASCAVPLIDSVDALALAAIEWYFSSGDQNV